jgi:hypothetical protein
MESRPIPRCYGFIATHVVRGPQGSVKPGSGPVTSVDAGHSDAAITFLTTDRAEPTRHFFVGNQTV